MGKTRRNSSETDFGYKNHRVSRRDIAKINKIAARVLASELPQLNIVSPPAAELPFLDPDWIPAKNLEASGLEGITREQRLDLIEILGEQMLQEGNL